MNDRDGWQERDSENFMLSARLDDDDDEDMTKWLTCQKRKKVSLIMWAGILNWHFIYYFIEWFIYLNGMSTLLGLFYT